MQTRGIVSICYEPGKYSSNTNPNISSTSRFVSLPPDMLAETRIGKFETRPFPCSCRFSTGITLS